ncbi:hypothetical protein EVAR_85832_1 [Eumeta japonica]|uniref:Uncharacterized protein n=1 Tax=Eumeta variegata TaxID=151549 RepID=A0A4C1UQ92_EUMVA|nr:hypothetical protein EVAR_85832_1 [Eumeta japonica]
MLTSSSKASSFVTVLPEKGETVDDVPSPQDLIKDVRSRPPRIVRRRYLGGGVHSSGGRAISQTNGARPRQGSVRTGGTGARLALTEVFFSTMNVQNEPDERYQVINPAWELEVGPRRSGPRGR